MALHQHYMLEEVDILQPRRIVGMGGRAHKILTQWFKDDSRVCHMPHYSPRIASAQNFEKVSQAITAIRDSLSVAEQAFAVSGPVKS